MQATKKYSTEGKEDPNVRFQGKQGVDNKVEAKGGKFENLKPEERK